MYLIKFLTLALASSSGLAWPHPPHPHEHPNCTVGIDTESCTLPDGSEGMFLCHPRHFPHWDGDNDSGDTGLLGSIVGGFHHMMGHHHHDHPHHHDDHGHGRTLLRSGSSSSSSSIDRHHGHGHHGGKGRHHGHDGGHDHHHHGGGGRGHHDGGRSGGRGCHRRPGLLSQSRCVPVDPKDDFPFHHPGGGFRHGGFPFHKPPATCGCCGDVCPVKIDTMKCGCSCDLSTDNSEEEDGPAEIVERKGAAGVWVTVTLRRDTTKTIKKCVPVGAYAEADRVQCVTECSAIDEAEEEEQAKELLAEEEDYELEEKESRD